MNRKIRLGILRWHRRLGVLIALAVVVLCITGIALNHTSKLRLSERPLNHPWLLGIYGAERPQIISFDVGLNVLSQLDGSRLYLNSEEVAYCPDALLGAARFDAYLAALCFDQLIILTQQGEVVERIGEVFGLPANTRKLASFGETLVLGIGADAAAGAMAMDFQTMTFVETQPPQNWSEPVATPPELLGKLNSTGAADSLNLERLMLDLHSGRIFGRAGPLLMDAAAVLLMFIALSGVWVWLTKPGRWR